jgi:hypothetical protein
MNTSVNGANLSSTSWTTASATGALGYMSYAEAKRFAKAYDIQALLLRTQEDEFRTASSALAIIAFSPGGPDTLTDAQLRRADGEILNCLSEIMLWDQIAAQLSAEYGRVLRSNA